MAKNNSDKSGIIAQTLAPGAFQEAYWNGFITRGEAQEVFDEYAATSNMLLEAVFGKFSEDGKEMVKPGLAARFLQMEILLGAVAQKIGITPEEVRTFATNREAELRKQLAVSEAKPSIITEA